MKSKHLYTINIRNDIMPFRLNHSTCFIYSMSYLADYSFCQLGRNMQLLSCN